MLFFRESIKNGIIFVLLELDLLTNVMGLLCLSRHTNKRLMSYTYHRKTATALELNKLAHFLNENRHNTEFIQTPLFIKPVNTNKSWKLYCTVLKITNIWYYPAIQASWPYLGRRTYEFVPLIEQFFLNLKASQEMLFWF